MNPICGTCLCGRVSYEINEQPVGVANCHCLACQKATGAAYFTEAEFSRAAVKIEGSLTVFETRADSGNPSFRAFCSACGSLIAGYGAPNGRIAIAVSTMADAKEFRPEMDIYVASAQPWVALDPAIPKYPGRPTG